MDSKFGRSIQCNLTNDIMIFFKFKILLFVVEKTPPSWVGCPYDYVPDGEHAINRSDLLVIIIDITTKDHV